jgi:hypothetical protein
MIRYFLGSVISTEHEGAKATEGEWRDHEGASSTLLSLENVSLYHHAFGALSSRTRRRIAQADGVSHNSVLVISSYDSGNVVIPTDR